MPTTATPTQCDKRGSDLILYYNLGDDTIPDWVEHLNIVQDMTLNETEDEDELSNRSRSRLVKEYISGEVSVSVSGQQGVDSDYEGNMFLNAMRSGSDARDVAVLTGPIDEVGSVGWRGKWRNKDRTINGPQAGAMTQNFNLFPAACTDIPVRPVKIAVADTIADYDPGDFVAAAGVEGFDLAGLGLLGLEAPVKKTFEESYDFDDNQLKKLEYIIRNTHSLQVNLPYAQMVALFGEDAVNELMIYKVALNQVRLAKRRPKSQIIGARRIQANNLAGFWRSELVEVLDGKSATTVKSGFASETETEGDEKGDSRGARRSAARRQLDENRGGTTGGTSGGASQSGGSPGASGPSTTGGGPTA